MSTVRQFLAFSAVLLTAATVVPQVEAAQKGEYLMYVGSYTRGKSKGVSAFKFDAATGKVTPVDAIGETTNPSWVTIHPSGRFLYAANEIGNFNGERAGSVTAFAIDRASGKLTQLNAVSSGGQSPCHIAVDRKGRFMLVANYGGGSVAVYSIKKDGSLGERTAFVQHEGSSVDPRRQRKPFAHGFTLSRDDKFALVNDLGTDKIVIYKLDAKGGLTPTGQPGVVKPGSGPRHFAFHPSYKYGYAINEMGNTITAFAWDGSRGALTEIQSVGTLPEGFTARSNTAEIVAHPSGKFIYGSNRGHDSIAVFAVDQSKGTLTFVEHVPSQGKTPRGFAIDPTGKWMVVANQDTENMVIFGIDPATGKLTPTGQTIEVGAPVSIAFVK